MQTGSIETLLGQEVGKYRLNTEFVHHNSNFQTASWWEDTTILPGIYSIMIGKNTYDYRNPFGLHIHFEGTLTADFFPSSFGGVPFGKYESQNLGAPRKIIQGLGWDEAIQRTGSSPSTEGAADIFVDYKFWPAVTAYLQKRLETDLSHFEKEKFTPELQSIRSLNIRSRWIAESSKALETILQATQYHKEPHFARLHEKNTAWATGVELKAAA